MLYIANAVKDHQDIGESEKYGEVLYYQYLQDELFPDEFYEDRHYDDKDL